MLPASQDTPARPQPRPIPTAYAGHHFRSRLEARWAVFFDTAGIPWRYEPQGYIVDGRAYLPDFYLPTCGTWAEVKGNPADVDLELLSAAAATLPTLSTAFAEYGPPMLLLGDIPTLPTGHGDWGWAGWLSDGSPGERWGFGNFHSNMRPWWLTGLPHYEPSLTPVHDPDEDMSPVIAAAYLKARSARFEHGQRGRT